MDILICCKNSLFEKTENKRKRVRVGPFFKERSISNSERGNIWSKHSAVFYPYKTNTKSTDIYGFVTMLRSLLGSNQNIVKDAQWARLMKVSQHR